ncbi:demethoxyubiquinone hydroxylase family protein [Neptuniibacter sp. QD34_54]|uniref:demethoxyubiquinone hydroxylase family protein n=1 Tax=Neptuniibacter sp. QD34_54 TaxID=3398208 RepID=UPI0039F63165
MNIECELRIMHACELGAVGVYRGHKCVARYFFRANLAELDNMRFHEKSHATTFKELLKARNARLCIANSLFFFGGLFYGVTIGMLGIKAIGTSTFTIESIVMKEFDIVLCQLPQNDPVYAEIQKIQHEEQEHQQSGQQLAGGSHFFAPAVEMIAKFGAYTAKYLASKL